MILKMIKILILLLCKIIKINLQTMCPPPLFQTYNSLYSRCLHNSRTINGCLRISNNNCSQCLQSYYTVNSPSGISCTITCPINYNTNSINYTCNKYDNYNSLTYDCKSSILCLKNYVENFKGNLQTCLVTQFYNYYTNQCDDSCSIT